MTIPGRRQWLLITAWALAVCLLTVAHHSMFTSRGRYANRDFMSLWCSGRALLEGLNPYEPGDWLSLRARYGSTWMPDERDPFPLWTAVLMLPWALWPLDWAAAAWLVFAELITGACVIALSLALRGKSGPVVTAVLCWGAFLTRGVLTGLNNGQITFVLLFALTSFVVLNLRRRPFWAGLALSLIALKPNPFILLAPLVALWLLYRRRWQCIGGLLAGAAAMSLASWLLRPGWLFEWLGARAKAEATFLTPTVWGVAHAIHADWWPLIGLAAAIGVTAALGWATFVERGMGVAEVVSLGIAGSLLVTPYAWAYDHALLILPMTLAWARAAPPRRAWMLWGALLAVPWMCYAVAEHVNRDFISALVPLTVGATCYAVVRAAKGGAVR